MFDEEKAAPPSPRAIQRFNQLLAQANAGDPAAQYDLGACYDFGYSAPIDKAQAIRWYRRAANNGHPGALLRLEQLYEKTNKNALKLGEYYYDGNGALQYRGTPKPWHSLTPTDQEEVQVAFELAFDYSTGKGVIPKDARKARACGHFAAAREHKNANRWLQLAINQRPL